MINEKVYQSIYDELSDYLVPGWEKLIVYLEYGMSSYSISFFIKESGKYIKCFDLPGVSERSLNDSFKKIDKLISKERCKEKENVWTNMTMTVSSNGDMHTDFDYSDLSEKAYEFKKNWKKKYLI